MLMILMYRVARWVERFVLPTPPPPYSANSVTLDRLSSRDPGTPATSSTTSLSRTPSTPNSADLDDLKECVLVISREGAYAC